MANIKVFIYLCIDFHFICRNFYILKPHSKLNAAFLLKSYYISKNSKLLA
jgi:hypothetical protein